ncbi:MAG TPA: cytochrome c oxidase subunit 3 [Thermoanaerobaculia bacterium]|jgi:heme/copper-type cytochrome/quinol oxidase subunit 3|nr:cytochrome c oxidase subunit 3 [Thermoanaerobaculia bacterium]
MSERPVLDVSGLPTTAFGHRDPLWWGLAGLMSIEGTMFAIMAASYFYLRGGAHLWPPAGTLHPGLGITTLNLAILLASIVPMHFAADAAEREDLPKIRLWLIVATVLIVAFLGVRIAVLQRLTFRWNSHAYGSLIWTTVGLHTLHVVTGIVENLLLITLLTKGPVEDKHMDDMRLNSMYWYFVVACWVPFYCIFFLDPGLLGASAG